MRRLRICRPAKQSLSIKKDCKTLKNKAMIVYLNVTNTPYISIARHYGGAKINGFEYVYYELKDALIRKDWTKKLRGKSWKEFLELVRNEQ